MQTAPFVHTMEVRFADTDANGHVFFANYQTYFDTALLRLLDHIGFSFDWFVKNNLNFYYVEAAAQFKSSLTWGDDISVSVDDIQFGNTSFTMNFEGRESTSGRLAATGHIVSVVVDKKSEKPLPVPEAFKSAVQAFFSNRHGRTGIGAPGSAHNKT